MISKIINNLIKSTGYHISRENNAETYAEFYDLYQFCRPYTMTGIERMYALYKSIEYIAVNNIEGDFVECGVWRGGSSMLVAMTLLKFGISDKRIYMYDTFDGMSEPTIFDKDTRGVSASEQLKSASKQVPTSVWCFSSFDEVKANMAKTKYPGDNIILVKGKVEETIPKELFSKSIAVLRLDTDWYESTKHELNHLFPILVKGGILIIDDYGHWLGARKAVDEYFAEHKVNLFLQPIDYTGRLAVKL